MCYKISLTKPQLEVEDRFDARIEDIGLYEPIYNLNGFSKEICYIVTQEDDHIIEGSNWGMKPYNFLSTEPFNRNALNAKSETVLTSPLFREPTLERRCLILADGFFESKHVGKEKIPHYIHLKDKKLFAFAGIYNFHDDGVFTCSILTMPANDFMAEIHNSKKRMPLILDETFEDVWLDNGLSEDNVKEVIANSFTKETLEAYTVSKEVNKSKVDTNFKEILNPVTHTSTDTLF